MCKHTKNSSRRIDPCIKNLIKELKKLGLNIKGCCCGHKKYPLTIVVERADKTRYDLVSNVEIPRRKKSYKRDKEGYYYIPETLEGK